MSKFDWYQTTIRAEPSLVLQTISKLGDQTRVNDRVGKMYRFQQGFEVHKQGNPVAYIALGHGDGDDALHHAHAWATSDNAPAFADLVRNEWPDSHQVTRLDACHDFIDKTAFPRLCKIARKVAKEHRVKFPRIQDVLDPTAGVTQYLGAPSSEYRARIYEKGWEVVNKAMGGLRGKVTADQIDSVRVPDIDRSCHPSEWVRLELQARPKDEAARTAAAHATPDQVWTFTSWSHHLAREAIALDLARFYVRQRKITTDERSLRFMCQQYGNMLIRLHSDLGDWSCVGLQIEQTIKDVEAYQKSIKGR